MPTLPSTKPGRKVIGGRGKAHSQMSFGASAPAVAAPRASSRRAAPVGLKPSTPGAILPAGRPSTRERR
jgi:hypothetical protein